MSKDDILDDEFWEEGDKKEKSSASTKDEVVKEVVKEAESVSGGFVPILVGRDYPESYKEVVSRFMSVYEDLPRLNYKSLHQELAGMNVDSSPTPTLQLINLKLQKVQAYKDRLQEIHGKVIHAYTFKKRAVSILTEAWGQFADGSSADKRKSESAYRLSDFHMDFAQTEALLGVCDNILRNLDSQSNSISRQITVIQSQLKMFDMGRGALPDFDFNKSALNEGFESLGDPVADGNEETKREIDESVSLSAEELSF